MPLYKAQTSATINIIRLRRTTTQTISHNTPTKVEFDTEDVDTGADFDNITNYRWTPPVGNVIMEAHIGYTSGTTSAWLVQIYKNGVALPNVIAVSRSASLNNETIHISVADTCNGTDYYEVFVSQFSGGSVDLTNNNCAFSGISFS